MLPQENDPARVIDVLTINEGPRGVEGLLDIVEKAGEYFPRGSWEEIEYLGNLSVERDVRIASNKKLYDALIFEKVVKKIRGVRGALKARELLLGVTRDPVVDIRFRFEAGTIRRSANLVHDYVTSDIGVVSLFKIDEDAGEKLTAHGLGHSRGLSHHSDPIDLMYIGLLRNPEVREPFCRECVDRLKGMG